MRDLQPSDILPNCGPAARMGVGVVSASIVQGDAFALLAAMPDGGVGHIITDLPYDARTHVGQRSQGGTVSAIDFPPITPEDLAAIVPEMLRVAQRWVVTFCSLEQFGDYRRAAGEGWVRAGFWRKPDGAPQFTGDRPAQPGEGLAIMHRPGKKRWNGGGRHAFWECGVERKDRCFSCQKPLALMRQLIEDFTDEGDLVLDPFSGSFSTGVACVQTGRQFVGIDSLQANCLLGRERINAAEEGQSLQSRRAGQTTLLEMLR